DERRHHLQGRTGRSEARRCGVGAAHGLATYLTFIVLQNSSEATTWVISKSTRSSQRAIHSLRSSRLTASINWKQRRPEIAIKLIRYDTASGNMRPFFWKRSPTR